MTRFAKVAFSSSREGGLTYSINDGDEFAIGDRVIVPLKPKGGEEIEREGEIVALDVEEPTFITKAIKRKVEKPETDAEFVERNGAKDDLARERSDG